MNWPCDRKRKFATSDNLRIERSIGDWKWGSPKIKYCLRHRIVELEYRLSRNEIWGCIFGQEKVFM